MTPSSPPLDRAARLGLAAMGVAVLVIANDFTALSVAIPAIESTFQTDVTTAQWVINGYALVFGVAIVTGGRLADMFGRRRVFFIGCVLFAAFSLLGGAAPNVGTLLGARAVMGIGGALMWPAIMGMTYALLPKGKEGLAGGLILGAAGFGNAVGPLIGGAADRHARLALDLLPQSADRGVRDPRDLEGRRHGRAVHRRSPARLSGSRHPLDRTALASARARSGLRRRLDPSADPGAVRPLRRGVHGVRPRREARRSEGAHSAGRSAEPGLLRGVHHRPSDVGDLLRGAPLRSAVHDEDPQLLGHEGGRGTAAHDGRLRGDLLRGRTALQPPGPEAHRLRRRGVPRRGDVPALADRGRTLPTRRSSRAWRSSASASAFSTPRSRRPP